MLKAKLNNVLAVAMLAAVGSVASVTSLQAEEPKAEAPAAGDTKPADGAAAPAAAAPAGGGDAPVGSMTTGERVKAAPVGTLKNPYTGDATAIEEGKKLYFSNSCNGCHGGGGGGGMCPPLTNQVWVYGSDDDTIFRLITQGSKELGRPRKGSENVKGPMPPYVDIITKEEDLWKIIAWMRTLWRHGDKGKDW